MQFIHIPASVCPTLRAGSGPLLSSTAFKNVKIWKLPEQECPGKKAGRIYQQRHALRARNGNSLGGLAQKMYVFPLDGAGLMRSLPAPAPATAPLPVPFVPPFILPPWQILRAKISEKKARDKELGNEKGNEKETLRKIRRFSNQKWLVRHGDQQCPWKSERQQCPWKTMVSIFYGSICFHRVTHVPESVFSVQIGIIIKKKWSTHSEGWGHKPPASPKSRVSRYSEKEIILFH